ncbi:hypothetical protein BA768_03985 [Chryseobacterium sp. CBo1]|nr:hypothetical protein BA768_03985 [Chryseobacterium sp. CBo1]
MNLDFSFVEMTKIVITTKILAPIAALFELISYVSTAWLRHAVETYEIASAESGKELLKNI